MPITKQRPINITIDLIIINLKNTGFIGVLCRLNKIKTVQSIECEIRLLRIDLRLSFQELYTILKIFNLFYLFHNTNKSMILG